MLCGKRVYHIKFSGISINILQYIRRIFKNKERCNLKSNYFHPCVPQLGSRQSTHLQSLPQLHFPDSKQLHDSLWPAPHPHDGILYFVMIRLLNFCQ